MPRTDDIARAADVIVSMGCGDACPILSRQRHEDWELTDPAGRPIEVVREARDDIEARVRRLLASLVPTGPPPACRRGFVTDTEKWRTEYHVIDSLQPLESSLADAMGYLVP